MWKALGALLCHLQTLVDEPLREGTFNLDGKLIEEALRVLAEDESESLQNDEVFSEIGVLGHFDLFTEAISLHFCEEGLDDLGDQ